MRLVAALLVTLLVLPCLAQTPAYEELLVRAKAADPKLDFIELRQAYTESPGYAPYGLDEATRDGAMEAMKAGDYPKARQLAEKLLSDNYLDLEGHLIGWETARRLGDSPVEQQHRFMLDGLFKAIGESGDGKSPETAWKVIAIREMYIWCQVLGASVLDQSLLQEGGHNYDVLTVQRQGETARHKLYFNVDIPFAWMEKNL